MPVYKYNSPVAILLALWFILLVTFYASNYATIISLGPHNNLIQTKKLITYEH